MRIVDATTVGKCNSVKDPASFGSHNLVTDELGLLLKVHETREDQRSLFPNRSGSAPPSMEGSYASSGNLLYSRKSSWDSTLASSGSGFHHHLHEDKVRSDSSNYVNSSSQPFMSREGKKQMHYMGVMGSNLNLRSSGGSSSDGSLLLTRSSLSTHHEDPEDDITSQKASEDLADISPSITSVQDVSSLAGHHKNLVDLIQANISRTPSSEYNKTHFSSHVATNEKNGSDIETLELDNLSLKVTKSPDPKPSVNSGGKYKKSYRSKVIDNSFAGLLSKNAYLDKSSGMISPQKNIADSMCKIPGKDGLFGSKDPLSNDANTQDFKTYEKYSIPQPHQHSQVQVTAQSNNMIGDSGQVLQGRPNFSLLSSGLTPPLYASVAAYMASGGQYFSYPHPPVYAPQYSTGGYAYPSTFVAGYPYHAGLSIGFDPSSTQRLNSQTIVSPLETNTQAGELPLYNRLYGHQGFVVQPRFPDPLQMQYFHYPSENSFSPQYGCIPPANFLRDQFGPSAPQRDPTVVPYIGDKKFLLSLNASRSVMSPRNVGMPSNNFYGNTAGSGYVPHYPDSLGSPLMPGSPVGTANHSGRRYDRRFPRGFVRNSGVYAQVGHDSHIDSKKHSFLEELKANNAHKINLSDIAERILEFSVDQHGSRFIQQKLENCNVEEKVSVFKEVLPHALRLMTDVFGNYVIQKFFEHGDSEQRKELASKMSGQMLSLCFQMYGCRVIQKALEVIELDQKTTLALELDGHVMRCVLDQNGNHVIQKCIESLPSKNIGFIISAFKGNVSTLSTHPYGCRVIQRVLEHCSDESQTQCIVDEILESSYVLAQDQFGNYVTQHVLERGKPHERSKILSKLQGKIIQMSQHKYASNVVEKCLKYGDAIEREIMVNEILAQPEENDDFLMMMKDQYANYVVQKILEISNDKQHDLLLKRIQGHLDALKKYTYGKHIASRFERLSVEEEKEEEKLLSVEKEKEEEKLLSVEEEEEKEKEKEKEKV